MVQLIDAELCVCLCLYETRTLSEARQAEMHCNRSHPRLMAHGTVGPCSATGPSIIPTFLRMIQAPNFVVGFSEMQLSWRDPIVEG